MTRFHIIFMLALLAAILTLVFHIYILFAIVVILFLIVMGLGVAFPQLSLFGNFICRGKNPGHCVALTFDDGPDARSTPMLLDLLKEAKIKAAFFCVGEKVAANRELAARIVREGHLLENHSYAHSHFTNFFSIARLQTEIVQTQTAIQAATGILPRFFRPPMGLSNPRIFSVAHQLNLKVIGWSNRGLDTQISEPEKIVARISRRLKSRAIILLHDGNIPAERLALTVKLLLTKLRERGYEVVRLDKMLE